MKTHRYCYHITNGATRSALQCGTVTAPNMEDAATIAAKRSGLVVSEVIDALGFPSQRWATKDGKRRSVYIQHDPRA